MNEITDFEASVPTEAAELIIVFGPDDSETHKIQEDRTRPRRNALRVIERLRRRP